MVPYSIKKKLNMCGRKLIKIYKERTQRKKDRKKKTQNLYNLCLAKLINMVARRLKLSCGLKLLEN